MRSSSLLPGAGGPDAEPVRAAAALRRLLEVERHRPAVLVERRSGPAAGRSRIGTSGARSAAIPAGPGASSSSAGQPGGRPAHVGRPTVPHRPGGSGPAGGRSAAASATRERRPAGRAGSAARPRHRRGAAGPAPTGSRTTAAPGRRPGGAPTRSTVTPAAPAHGPGPSGPPSTTTSRCGSAAPGPGRAPGELGGPPPAHRRRRSRRPCGAGRSASRRSRMGGVRQPADPVPLRPRAPAGRSTASRASAGLCSSAYCTTSARARARAAAGSRSGRPVRARRCRWPAATRATGSSGTTACPRRNRRRASAVIGSMPSTGPVCGATRRVASHWSPQPDPELAEVRIGRARAPTAGPRRAPRARPPDPGAAARAPPAARRRCRRTRRRSSRQVAQVVAAVLVDPGGPVAAAAAAGPGQHHAQGRDREHPAEQPRRRVARAEHGDEADRARAASRPAAAGPARRPARSRSGSGGGSTSSSPPGSRGGTRGGRVTSTVHVGPVSGLRTGASPGRHEFGQTATAADLALSCFVPGC